MPEATASLWWPSPNFGPRRDGARPDLLLIHYTAMTSAEAARDWLCAPKAEVSAHYVIARDGRVWQLVDEAQRAWHAGLGAWGDCADVNSRSIGIELDNDGLTPFAAPLMSALEGLMAGIMARWQIAPARVLGHSDIAPGRKIDPGRRFDWARLARQGLALAPVRDPQPVARPESFWTDAARFGYRWAPGQEAAVLDSFRARFRPQGRGPLGAADAAQMAALAARWPCVDQSS